LDLDPDKSFGSFQIRIRNTGKYSQEDWPDSIVQLYLGNIEVLTNTSTLFVGALAIVEGSEKDQEAGLEVTETFLLCGRAAQITHIKNTWSSSTPWQGCK
jgi:lipoprotein NlpI